MTVERRTGSAFSWYVVSVLAAVYAVSFLDRQVINILGQSIKSEMHISDAQLGLLTGTAFGLFYSFLGIPIARAADRMHRVNIITVALIIWSGLTALGGITHSYTQLFLARLGVGVGEAGGAPPAQSLISDYVTAQQRTRAFSLFNVGIPVGSLLGFLLGGYVSQRYGWRVAFVVAGVPGLFFAALLKLTVREPLRAYLATANAAREVPNFRGAVRQLWTLRSYVRVICGSCFAMFTMYVTNAWLPAMFIRVHGFSQQRIGTWLALAVGIGGSIGIVGGGWLAAYVRRSANSTADLWVVALCTALACPALIITVWNDNIPLALGGMFLLYVLGYVWMGPNSSRVQELVPVHSRALAVGFMLFLANIIGLACGPPLVGLLSDLLKPSYGVDSLRWALSISSVSAFISAASYVSAAKSINKRLNASRGGEPPAIAL